MTRIEGVYYDGKISRANPVELVFDARGNLKVSAPEISLEYTFDKLSFSPRIGNTRRDIYLPDGGKCEIYANETIDALLRKHRVGNVNRLIHSLENHLGYVLVSVALTLGFVWGFGNYGIPMIAKEVALALPPETDVMLGKHTLEVLDRWIFSESQVPEEQRIQLQRRFLEMRNAKGDRQDTRLLFRNSKAFGANALALPSGIVVITDDLIEMAEHENELVAILAHELGHVKHRHGLRTVLQGSALVLVISWLTGDISSLSALSAALPVKIIEAKYSRQFESEADEFARDYMIANRIPLHRFSDILSRLGKLSPSSEDSLTFLSSHPPTEERIKLFAEIPESINPSE
jgi:Zn-dependent protease with chaperone function